MSAEFKRRNCRSGDPNLTSARKRLCKNIVAAMKEQFDTEVRITKVYPSLGFYRSSRFNFDGSARWEAWGETRMQDRWGKFGHWYSFDRLTDCAKFKIVLSRSGGVDYEVSAPEAPDFDMRNNRNKP